MTDTELAKMQLIYAYLFMTDNPNKTSQEVRKKLKKKLRWIMAYKEAQYERAKALKEEAYKKAWYSLFQDKNDGVYISLGTFMNRLYNSIEKQTLVGHSLMKKMFDSYHHCDSHKKLTEIEEVEMEQNADKLAKEVLKLLGDKVESPLHRRRRIIEENLIIEGKIT